MRQCLNITEKELKVNKLTCCHCGKPLLDNSLVKQAYTVNNVSAHAKMQLKILHDMAKDRSLGLVSSDREKILASFGWMADKILDLSNGIVLLDDTHEKLKLKGELND